MNLCKNVFVAVLSGMMVLSSATGLSQTTTLPPQSEEMITEAEQPQRSLESTEMIAPATPVATSVAVSSARPVALSQPSKRVAKHSRTKARTAKRNGSNRKHMASRSSLKKSKRHTRGAQKKSRGRYVRASSKRPVV